MPCRLILRFAHCWALLLCLLPRALAADAEAPAAPPIISIMPLGDSITQGGAAFACYRYPLWEKLFAGGYLIRYAGSQSGETRIGPLSHEGYGGKTAEYLAASIERLYRANPAAVVLLHAGHNHASDEKPVAGIVAANESIIRTIQSIRPDAVVLLAQVIPSGKLPKYAYIPELNEELARLAARMNTDQRRVILVSQAEGFDWRTDTVADLVHPNARGAEKMADKWFDALAKVLPAPAQAFKPERVTYKKPGQAELKLHIFRPVLPKDGPPRPAIVFFFGGGWTHGTPLQFYRECAWFASRGMVAISADYRIATVDKSTPFDSLEDAKSAVRWVRQHAAELGIDPARIAAAGASAGGHLAAAAALAPGFDAPGDDVRISARPDALLLWYPVIDNGPDGYGSAAVKARHKEFSPLHAMTRPVPPTILFLGDKDRLIPVATAERYKKRIEELGGRCDLRLYPDAGHPIYEYRKGQSPAFHSILREADAFLVSLGYLPPPTR